MKNNLWIILISVVISLSSCITAAQFNNADDDVYYSPKASNRKEPVMIPEVDVDEIIRQNPPQYGEPTNRLDDDGYTTNSMAAMYYPVYRSYQQDTFFEQNQRVSAYIDPSLATESETQEAEYLRHMYSGSSNWNAGIGLSWWGPTFSVGYSNYPYGYYGGYDPYCSPYGYYPSCGYGYGYGYYPYYNPYYYGIGYGWCSPWYGYNNYCPPASYTRPDNGNSNTGISRPRPTVGNNTPPANTGRNTQQQTSAPATNGQYVAPLLPGRANQQNTQQNGTPNYTPTTPQQSLENVNGRQVYKRPAEAAQPANQGSQTNTGTPARGRTTTQGTNRRTTNPTYSAPAQQQLSTPTNVGRSGSSGQGGGRSSGGSSGGTGSGGRRR